MGKMRTVTASDGVTYEYFEYERNEGSVGRRRIVFIGASYKFVHKVVRDMLLVGGFDECELVLLDIAEKPLQVVGDLLEKMIAQAGSKMTLTRTLDREEALRGASAALLSITVGGEEADLRAAESCARFDIPVAIGDTLGPAALARNLRTLPVVLEIARDMERLSPEAVLINFTNPLSCVTGVVLRETSVPAFGLCHSVEDLATFFGKIYGCSSADVEMESGGVNHMSFITSLKVEGEERIGSLYEDTAEAGGVVDSLLGRVETAEIQRRLFRILGAWPSTGGDHAAEFFPSYLREPRRSELGLEVKEVKEDRPERPPQKEPPEILLKWTYGDGPVEDMELLTTEHAHELMWAAMTGEPDTRVVNVLNEGAIPGIADDACVEIWATASGAGCRRRPVELPKACLSLVRRWTAIHELTYTAALEADRDAALQALVLDPHVVDVESAEPLLDTLVERLSPWLPGWPK